MSIYTPIDKTPEVKFEALVELSREAEDNATSRELWRIPPPAVAAGFQVAGLIMI